MSLDSIFTINSAREFEQKALEVFQYQFENNSVYRSFCDLLYKHPAEITRIKEIPFLPIEFFKSKKVVSNSKKTKTIFTSSGTTGTQTSKHFVTDLNLYEQSFYKGFRHFYGPIEDFVVLGLLPSYLERKGSSLIYMVNDFISKSNHPESGFYLGQFDLLAEKLISLDAAGKKTLLIGVSFALLDLVETYQFALNNTIVMETGGMKGRRKEMIRVELHQKLKAGFGVTQIHSEYGMTELLSQAYSKGEGLFQAPPWMKIIIRDPEDALTLVKNQNGTINVIDLANSNSCSFIATQDLGRVFDDESFEIMGRFDNSDIRGCNLMLL